MRNLAATVLLDTPHLSIRDVRCGSCRSGWSEPELGGAWALVLARRGCFRRLVNGREAVVEPSVAYLQKPADEQQVAHPGTEGDVCTSISFSEGLASEVLGIVRPAAEDVFFTTNEIDMAHRFLIRSARNQDSFELSERAISLASRIVERRTLRGPCPVRPSTIAAQRHAVDAVRELLVLQPTTGLMELAKSVAVSPHHLSRIFKTATGESISRFRNRVRVRYALEQLAEGEQSLARLAAETGFADHAHLTRTIRAETGFTPSALRRLLAA